MRLTQFFTVFILTLSTSASFAQSGKETEDRQIAGFHGVSMAGSFDVYITQGSEESVKVEAPADVIHKIITEVKGGTLNIYPQRKARLSNKKIVVYVSTKEINSINLAGSGNVDFKEGISAETLQLGVSGSGNLSGKLIVQSLQSNLIGSGNIKIEGSAKNSNVSISGSGNFKGRNLAAINAIVHVVGSGNADVNVTNNLDANVTGSGSIHYVGIPVKITRSKTGSGSIESLQGK